jgi:hypothetical protein
MISRNYRIDASPFGVEETAVVSLSSQARDPRPERRRDLRAVRHPGAAEAVIESECHIATFHHTYFGNLTRFAPTFMAFSKNYL